MGSPYFLAGGRDDHAWVGEAGNQSARDGKALAGCSHRPVSQRVRLGGAAGTDLQGKARQFLHSSFRDSLKVPRE